MTAELFDALEGDHADDRAGSGEGRSIDIDIAAGVVDNRRFASIAEAREAVAAARLVTLNGKVRGSSGTACPSASTQRREGAEGRAEKLGILCGQR